MTTFVKQVPDFQINPDNTLPSSPTIASLSNDGFIVTWTQSNPSNFNRDVYGQLYDVNGNPVNSAFKVSDQSGQSSSNTSIATLTNGEFVITWNTQNFNFETDIYGQRYDLTGNPVGQAFQVNDQTDGDFNQIVTPLNNGGFVVLWDTDFGGYNIYGQQYDANGTEVGTEFAINPTSAQGPQNLDSVVPLANGELLVTWSSDVLSSNGPLRNTYGQHYDANVNQIGEAFLIDPNFESSNALATSLTDGRYVITWNSFNADDSFRGFYGQFYNLDGTPSGPLLSLGTELLNQFDSSITALPSGGFLTTETFYYNQNELSPDIYSQQYDANGDSVGEAFRINSNPEGVQESSSVAVLGNGELAVVWSSFTSSTPDTIYGTIFAAEAETSNFLGIFEIDKLARSGYTNELSFNPVEIGGLPVANLYDETFYLNQNPDVAAAVNTGIVSNGYTHFVNYGQFEGRDPSILYDEDFYLEQNPDVTNAVTTGIFSSGFQHYAFYGQQEGRSPSTVFNEQNYRTDNPDVANEITSGGFISGFEHYLELGQAEGRNPLNFLYNEAYYLTQNPDVANAVALDVFQDGFEHYINYGQTEKRNPSSLFNENQYLTQNPDVEMAVSNDVLDSGFEHYILFGRFEGRAI